MPARKQIEESLKIEHKGQQTRQLAIIEGTERLEVLGARYDAGLDNKEKTLQSEGIFWSFFYASKTNKKTQ